MEQWHILDRNGNPEKEEELPERPADSNPAEGQAFRPWYKQEEHLHIESNAIKGIHAHGMLQTVQERLHHYLSKEPQILAEFGGSEDVLLPTVDNFLEQ